VLFAFVLGEVLGLSRFIIEIMINSGFVTNSFLSAFVSVNYLHFTILVFVFTSLAMIILSYVFHYGSDLSNSKFNSMIDEYFSTSIDKGIVRVSKGRIHVLASFFILLLTLSLWYLFV